MQKINSTKKFASIVVILLMASSVLMFSPQVKAAAGDTETAGPLPSGVTASVTVPTEAFLAITPNPVGLGQTCASKYVASAPNRRKQILPKCLHRNLHKTRWNKGHKKWNKLL